jgi:hypothetical protein
LTLPANDLPGSASSVMRTGCPAAIFGASTSSIGAVTYRHDSSIRSIAGGVGTPGGEGVEYSPISPTILATVPSNGATSTVRPCCTRASRTLASDCTTSARAVAHAARLASAAARAVSIALIDTKPFACSSVCRATSRSAESASVHASITRLRAVSVCAWASFSCAWMSSFHSRIRS